ncbi:MAG: glutathione S-transferase family protein [Candidatus Competibacteraceae bacterium]|nr:glutathione S-transferase family protein [Candidatus Competibacteraceae bacterium]
MLHVYGYPNTRSQRVVWALEEVGATYEYHPVNLLAGDGRQPDYLALNPGGKVPTLVDGELILSESAAICTYLGDRFPSSGLTPPAGSVERALYNQWCFFILSELEQPLWTITKHRFALPEKRRVPAIFDTAHWEWGVAAHVLATGLGERTFLVGERFTVADLLAAHTLAWARAFAMPFGHATLETYANRLLERSARAQAIQREQGVVPPIA